MKHRTKKLVYVSSTGAIPELPDKKMIVEVDSFNPDLVKGYYSKSKAMATQLVLDAVNSYGLDASIVFPSGIMGPYDYGFGFITKALIDFSKGRIPFAIDGTFNCTDARDLAAGILACCHKGRPGEGYIMANGTVSMRALFDIIANVSNKNWSRITFPSWIAGIFACISEAYGKVIGKQVLFTRFTIYNLIRNNNFSSGKATRELGYRTRPFEETIRDELIWLHEEGKVSFKPRTKR